ncbi:unnamed protein product [Orchesella dallaii]|uniref:Uncharacterized protein n=1 Tax=Orchesella dallaii TaxID=48710 RepID=A0ABP1RM05_9HEXA
MKRKLLYVSQNAPNLTLSALKCYNCGYFDGEAPDNWDEEDSEDSCRTGKKPNDELSVDCNDLRYFPVSEGKFIGIPKTCGLVRKSAEHQLNLIA